MIDCQLKRFNYHQLKVILRDRQVSQEMKFVHSTLHKFDFIHSHPKCEMPTQL